MEDIFVSVGEFGRFQYKITIIIGLISALTSACIYATVFIAAEPKLTCLRNHYYSNDSSKVSVEVSDEESCEIFQNLKPSLSAETQNYTQCSFDTH